MVWAWAVMMTGGTAAFSQESTAVTLPAGVKAEWDIERAWGEATSMRERICINGLWRWQPAGASESDVPGSRWGYFKVPGCWPGITDYMQKDSQTIHAHPAWKDQRFASVSAGWYERTVNVPPRWNGRRIFLSVEYLNSFATVFVNGVKRGELRFPGGELDLTPHLRPGDTAVLSLLVIAMPLEGVMLSYADSNSARQVKGRVERRGLCGDVFLASVPAGPRITDVQVNTSVRRSEITFDVALEALATNQVHSLRAEVSKGGQVVREFHSKEITADGLVNGRVAFTAQWEPEALWDIHSPANQYELRLTLTEAGNRPLDTYFKVPFGFREFWIDGRDFFLNGSRIFLSAVPLDNAQVGATAATYDGARESLERLKNVGINFVYTHNYGCEPGSHLGFKEILRAADDVGMLVSLSQPHFSHYGWQAPDAADSNGYAGHAAFYARAAGNHPSVVAYAMSHNATGYEEDMNPDLIDGVHAPRDQWSQNNSKLALRAEAIVQPLDPRRIVYHHASGHLGALHTVNFYPNFVPIQELSDWFGHWATRGVKPVFTCEFGAPFTWDWTMYRGWFNGEREFGSAAVPWEFCLAEWNSQFLGDRAFQISAREAANLRWEAQQFRAGKLWHRWDYPHPVGSTVFDERYPVFAMYLADNWRAFRTWGVSAISPWEHEHFWKLRDGVDRRRRECHVDWDHLQRPGFSPDYVENTYERWDLAFDRGDWVPTAAAQALIRHNRPLLAYVAGKPGHFTSKDHNFFPGETVEKQLIVINNSRERVTCDAEWSLAAVPEPIGGRLTVSIGPGGQERAPLRFTLPESFATGSCELIATARFSTGEIQSDSFAVHVLPRTGPIELDTRLALFDGTGETAEFLNRIGVRYQRIGADDDLSAFDALIVGKAALTAGGATPDIERVPDGFKVLVFEQTAEALERRLGFRVAEYGLRNVFARVPDHPALAGLSGAHWRDWRGEATILPPRLDYRLRPRYGPTVDWCGIPVPRLWRCGNRGNVASVLIEKPARGDFLPILDGGYNLQFSPLLEYRDAVGLILFCQLDVIGRTESDPAAETCVRNVLRYVSNWKPQPMRRGSYAGDPAGRRHFESAGFTLSPFDAGKLSTDQVLIISHGSTIGLGTHKAAIAGWLEAGGRLLAIGLDQASADALLPIPLTITPAEHISACFEPHPEDSWLRGVGPSDVHNRDPREIPLITSGAATLGNGVLAVSKEPAIVFCQLTPWQFDPASHSNLKRTYRRASALVTRLLTNLGVASTTPLRSRFNRPVDSGGAEKRWLDGLYLDQPSEWDDPYRFFRW